MKKPSLFFYCVIAKKPKRRKEMVGTNRLVKIALNVNNCRVIGARIESGKNGLPKAVVELRPYKRDSNRCPECGRKCPGYDTLGKRRWRASDINGMIVELEYEQKRICCKDHGISIPDVPWAYRGSSFTKDFDKTVAWLSRCISKSAIAEYMRIDWATVGRCISRVREDLEPDLDNRLNGLVNIGIDETSYKKGYKYITVIVNHDTNSVIWLHEGHGKSVLEKFYEKLSDKQRASIKVVTGDGARWITDCVKRYTPDCIRCMDAFHVVEWANNALDSVRLEECRKLKADVPKEKRSKGRPKKDDDEHVANKEKLEKANRIKGSAYAVGKAPEKLTEKQRETLEAIRVMTPRYYRAYDMKESLRIILKMDNYDDAKTALKKWFWRASHSRIESFKELAAKIKRNEEFILNTIKYGFSNARIEATNNKIKLIIRRSYGFKNINNMLDMIYLCCSSLIIPLPGRLYASKESA